MGASIYKNKKPAIIFLIPAFLFMIVYLYYPFLQNIWNSFQNIRQLGSSGEGFLDPWYSNYVEMFHDEVMWISLKNTDHDAGYAGGSGGNRYCPGIDGR